MDGAIPPCDINLHLPWDGSINAFGPSKSGKTYFILSILQERKEYITSVFVVCGGEAIARYREVFPLFCVFDNLEEEALSKLNSSLVSHTKWWRDFVCEHKKLWNIACKLFPTKKERLKYVISRRKVQRPLFVVIFDDLMTDKLMGKEKSIIVNLVTKFRHSGVLTFITAQRVNAKIAQSIVESSQATIAFTFGGLNFNKKLMDKIGSDFIMSASRFNTLIDKDIKKFSPDPAKIKVAFIRTNQEHKIVDKETGKEITTRTFYGIAPTHKHDLKISEQFLHDISEIHMDKEYAKNECFGSLDKTGYVSVKKLIKTKDIKKIKEKQDEIFYLDLSKT